jgi:hypothetical protein
MCCLIRVNLELFVVVNVTRGTDEERQMKGMFAANGLRDMGELFRFLTKRFWAPRRAPRNEVCELKCFERYFSNEGTQRNPMVTVGW